MSGDKHKFRKSETEKCDAGDSNARAIERIGENQAALLACLAGQELRSQLPGAKHQG
jgi:hypothetical protein